MTTINAMSAYNLCAPGDTTCAAGSLVQLKTLQADLKAKGMTLADTERIGLNSYIAEAEFKLGNVYGGLTAAAMGATGAKGNEAGNAQGAPLGRGATGRTAPRNIKEKFAMDEALSAPNSGFEIPIVLSDSRWPASEGWVKIRKNVNGIEIHYVKNKVSGAVDDLSLEIKSCESYL
ncbi:MULTISPECIES: hypothetical protein [unclassified Variovorax]|uniref:hypothetical protein n=1 Tax=unclassified Variovorax TaxID=663243 RepID=UPI00257507A9|nr:MULTISPECIES: hypothetical protein [unclassified Variovorax]MDM0087150.1 hypothetical protein [Variovorax sp. J22G40]MDM0144593.1 hypothetical protein [Variovorax sp. J2P1-31]